ncbi:hypothetical protein K438DRAFT_2147690, partial [Mycena galopus ATCC 62051]
LRHAFGAFAGRHSLASFYSPPVCAKTFSFTEFRTLVSPRSSPPRSTQTHPTRLPISLQCTRSAQKLAPALRLTMHNLTASPKSISLAARSTGDAIGAASDSTRPTSYSRRSATATASPDSFHLFVLLGLPPPQIIKDLAVHPQQPASVQLRDLVCGCGGQTILGHSGLPSAVAARSMNPSRSAVRVVHRSCKAFLRRGRGWHLPPSVSPTACSLRRTGKGRRGERPFEVEAKRVLGSGLTGREDENGKEDVVAHDSGVYFLASVADAGARRRRRRSRTFYTPPHVDAAAATAASFSPLSFLSFVGFLYSSFAFIARARLNSTHLPLPSAQTYPSRAAASRVRARAVCDRIRARSLPPSFRSAFTSFGLAYSHSRCPTLATLLFNLR